MARSGPEIQAALRTFADKWGPYAGTERAEAQTFLNELFACYGSDRQALGARFEDFHTSAGFMDLHWPGICIVEMKAPSRSLVAAYDQVDRYWRSSFDLEAGVRAARWVILCSFQRFEIYEPGRYPGQRLASFAIDELPDRYDVLSFLAGPHVEPVFVAHHRELTTQAAQLVAKTYHAVADRSGVPIDELQRFVMQSVWCMFAEDLGMLHDYPFQSIVRQLIADPSRSSAESLGYLFRVLNQKGSHNRRGPLAGTTYVNGELFAQPAEVNLEPDELRLLDEASRHDWTKVDPTIFGSLMESVLGRDRRWELGAHYTHEVDIMKIVGPTIVRPWLARIEATTSPAQARELLDELCGFRVLDPACGCGNFLYVAYRELRSLESELKQRIRTLAKDTGLAVPAGPWPHVPLANMQGIDIERTAVMIARVTLWMGHRQMIERFGEAEDPLPLVDLSGIRVGNALFDAWPETDCIVGNPPFLGAKHIRPNYGDAYADRLVSAFGVGVKDLCVYWFRRAQEHLRPGQRAGLVGTNSISQTGGRAASLDHLVRDGSVITDAISTQKWPGEAKVHVSIVNWIKQPPKDEEVKTLDGAQTSSISSRLRDPDGVGFEPVRLASNASRAFAGVVPQAKGFVLGEAEAEDLLGIDKTYAQVVRSFLTGDDLTSAVGARATRWIIDFGSMSLERAMRYPAALAILRERVKPERERSLNRAVEHRWWLFGRRVEGMRTAVAALHRYAAAASTGKRLILAWSEKSVCPNNAVCVFAFEDDLAMGVLQSRAHVAWAWHQSSTLKGDLRYTSASVFETFPWPDVATERQRDHVADVCRRMLGRRSELCVRDEIGLTKLYNAMDEGAYTDLKALHHQLDEAVADCYGWPRAIGQDDRELVARLTELNRQISTGERPYQPFGHLDSGDSAS